MENSSQIHEVLSNDHGIFMDEFDMKSIDLKRR
jgi:hypothetical protein